MEPLPVDPMNLPSYPSSCTSAVSPFSASNAPRTISRLYEHIRPPTEQPSSSPDSTGPSHQPDPTQVTSTSAHPESLV
ncbi:hypothetical protein RJT34_31242 [Clitoria ternatea]|uniref:Uncharacterized protein n=1 Tax=Clitoria ternatea TaxID=43366 RepID=A0AAN9I163_CLITE